MSENYNAVKKAVDEGKLRIIAIEAPARTNSTTLEIVVAESPSVDGHSNQPFHLCYDCSSVNPAAREEEAYGQILQAYGKSSIVTGKDKVTIVVKEMTRNLGFGKQFHRWANIADKNIFIIRNPQLAVESHIRLMTQALKDWKERIDQDPETYAKLNKFNSWDEMVTTLLGERNYTQLEQILREFAPVFDLNSRQDNIKEDYVQALKDSDAEYIGFPSLDYFAQANNYSNWGEMVVANLNGEQKRFEPFGSLLNKVFETSHTGWYAVEGMMKAIKTDNYTIIDGTVFRTAPKQALKKLSDYAGVEFSPEMISNWTKANKENFDNHANDGIYNKAFSRAANSTFIHKAKEEPNRTDAFPSQFKSHLMDTAYPIYVKMLSDEKSIRPLGDVHLRQLLSVKVDGDRTISDIDPIFTYSIVASDPKTGRFQKDTLLKEIRLRHAVRFGDIFNKIDQCVGIEASKSVTEQAREASHGL